MFEMNRFYKVFAPHKCNVIAMLHIEALPGTPRYAGNWKQIIQKAVYEAQLYLKHRVDAMIIENMHDKPYVLNRHLDIEVVACMTRLGQAVREVLPKEMPLGIQVLACGNEQALAVAKASQLQFVRAEGYVFGQVADVGYMDACAGKLLRYRKQIDAEDVLIFTDLKYHSHAVTADVSLKDTALAADFFDTDGIVLTNSTTGHPVDHKDVQDVVSGELKVPLLLGSGITLDNITHYYHDVQAVIVGSHFKFDGDWRNEISNYQVETFMHKIWSLRERDKYLIFEK
ncbi:uncharacterized protein F13E9.13, mitochondrial-like isoform X1 [Drosophila sulfurigaster albostrigata]|uniref:uncharacterized protein F13E9.13, mitochondrial-like isoform X1 n=3 Tax=nasuta subgroup TaxID=32307 RepID=UPI002D21B42E|nr:uncharacterized protein F13E9.13, mitochondrial-like isoform X1 [Drosophila sulfurigaster albostrigata]